MKEKNAKSTPSASAMTTAQKLLPTHRRMALWFGLLFPLLSHHLIQAIGLWLNEFYYDNVFTELGERLIPAALEVLSLLMSFLAKLGFVGLLSLYVMRRLRLPGDPVTGKWLRFLPLVLLLPHGASLWLAFVFGAPTWNSLGYLALNIFAFWALDLVTFGFCFWLTKRYYLRTYRVQADLAPGEGLLPDKKSPLLRLFFQILWIALAIQLLPEVINTVLLITAYGGPDSAEEVWTLVSPYLLQLVLHFAGYFLCIWVARMTQSCAPAEKDLFSKGSETF